MMYTDGGGEEPDWASDPSYSGPSWTGVIPSQLWQLGEVFFPIPPRRKAWRYPHHLDEYRFAADSKQLNAYLEVGWNYGVACANNLVVVDVDEPEYLDDITSKLPPTLWQQTGSREGYHLFYIVEGVNNKKKLSKEIDGEKVHVGDLKADDHGYVVGPGSLHPSGNQYGPLEGDEIATVTKENLLEALDGFIAEEPHARDHETVIRDWTPDESSEVHSLYELTADDVLPWLEEENRVAHPVHGSETGMNFMKNEGGETFTCWRCQYGSGPGCGLNGTQFLAAEETGKDCDEVRRDWSDDTTLHYAAWRAALDQSLINSWEIPYKVAHGYAVEEGIIEPDEKLSGVEYFEAMDLLWWEYVAERQIEYDERKQF